MEPGLSSPLQSKAATVQPSGGGTLRREWQQVKALYGCFARKTLAWCVWVGTLQG
ncbi:esterase/lipase [Acetobacter orientalis]|uniref:Esterase/lipase n=1 Tax=Acetobacter orientalis TaxID=146474 RepID=A0A2Z5ZM06_9PROT|nr:esterase/lipase [Acetobacter orientalis]